MGMGVYEMDVEGVIRLLLSAFPINTVQQEENTHIPRNPNQPSEPPNRHRFQVHSSNSKAQTNLPWGRKRNEYTHSLDTMLFAFCRRVRTENLVLGIGGGGVPSLEYSMYSAIWLHS